MQFGTTIGTACSTFAVTNIDDIFVLVTFFSEATTSKTLTPLKITIGQYAGFTAIIVVSMIGYSASLLLPSEPIGFLGLLPILLGLWKLFALIFPPPDDNSDASTAAGMKSILKVSVVTIMNGGDNIGTYIPLFSQAKGAEIAVYVVVYYILLGIWCLAAFLIMRQKHILRLVQKYIHWLLPFLYMGLGTFIIIDSDCYPWSIEHINHSTSGHPGRGILAGATVFALLVCMGPILYVRYINRAAPQPTPDDTGDASTRSSSPAPEGEIQETQARA